MQSILEIISRTEKKSESKKIIFSWRKMILKISKSKNFGNFQPGARNIQEETCGTLGQVKHALLCKECIVFFAWTRDIYAISPGKVALISCSAYMF